MQVPLELTFRDVPRTDEIESFVRDQAERLHRFCDGIIACRVAVEQTQRRHHTGNPHRVRIEVSVPPNADLVVTKEQSDPAHDALRILLREAFHAMERQLKEIKEKRRGDIKSHEEPRALVLRLFPQDGYGFLQTHDGRELYFHEHSVLHGDFARLAVGTEVRYAEEMGEKGPQASTVQIVAKPGARIGSGEPA